MQFVNRHRSLKGFRGRGQSLGTMRSHCVCAGWCFDPFASPHIVSYGAFLDSADPPASPRSGEASKLGSPSSASPLAQPLWV